ncbi:MAG: cytochrome C peroxidase, partial [Gammaproteobacteria bacterium]
DDALPLYDPFGAPGFPPKLPNTENEEAILTMPTAIDGAFKVSNLRNVTLTGPFFHNGGQRTLKEVVEFYNRGGDFAMENRPDLAPNIHPLGLDETQIDDIVAFLETLTDDRVRCQRAPFDHPAIKISAGHEGDTNNVTNDGTGRAADNVELIPAVGANGTPEEDCLRGFLE